MSPLMQVALILVGSTAFGIGLAPYSFKLFCQELREKYGR